MSEMLPGRRAVVGAVTREDLVAARREPRQLDGVLVGLGAAVGEEEDVDVAGAISASLAPSRARGSVAMNGLAYGERRRLILDGRMIARVAVAGVHAHQLTVEVDEALALRRQEIDALGARDGNGINAGLRRPFEERVLLRERDRSRRQSSRNAFLRPTRLSFPSCPPALPAL